MACGLPILTQVINHSLPSTVNGACTAVSSCEAHSGSLIGVEVPLRLEDWLMERYSFFRDSDIPVHDMMSRLQVALMSISRRLLL